MKKESKRRLRQEVVAHLQYTFQRKLQGEGKFKNFPHDIQACLYMIREYRWWKCKMFFSKFLLLIGVSLLLAGISTKVVGGVPILVYIETILGISLCSISGIGIYDLIKGRGKIDEEWIPGATAYKLVREWKTFLGKAKELGVIDKMVETLKGGVQAHFDAFIPHLLKQSATSIRRFEIDGKPEKKRPLREYMSKIYEFGKVYNVPLPGFDEFFVN